MPPPINKLSNIPLERLSSMSGAVLAFTIESARWTVACSSSGSGLRFNEKRAFKNAGCLRGRNRSLFRDTVVLEIAFTMKHMTVLTLPHYQGLSASILLNNSTEVVAFVPFLLYGTATVSSGRSE